MKIGENMLIDYLISKGYTHKKAKILLSKGSVYVNNKVITKYNYIVKNTDKVEIKAFNNNINNSIDVIYEDKDIIVVNKPPCLLTVSTSKEKDKTLYHIVSSYLKEKNKNAKVFIIHRLDKDTSGIVIFAKSERIKNLYQNNWDSLVKYRGYVAVIKGSLKNKKDIIKLKLKEEGNMKVYVDKNGKDSITEYEVIKGNNKYSLVNINLHTGRKNQIRVVFSYLGNPIVGDTKYGDLANKRLFLHAYKLVVINPITKKENTYEISIPKSFKEMVK